MSLNPLIPCPYMGKGNEVMNQKSGDFGSYCVPRLSVQRFDQEQGHQAPAHSNVRTNDDRRNSQVVN